MAQSIEQMKDKIAKLLAKAERTDNDHERDAYNEQAERLMLKLGIERAELESAGQVKPEEIVEVTREWTGNYSSNMVSLVWQAAQGFGNITVLQSKSSNGMRRWTYIIGHESDVEEFIRLVDSLALQVMSALKRYQRATRDERRYMTDMEKFVMHRSFIDGFSSEVRSRLFKERKQEEQQASPGAALVLVSKQERVDEWTQRTYNPRASRGGNRSHSYSAAQEGRRAGRQANLGEKGIGGPRGALQ